ncbi:TPA: hypothetical protein ACF2YT_001218 [Providencia alcalifaciens]
MAEKQRFEIKTTMSKVGNRLEFEFEYELPDKDYEPCFLAAAHALRVKMRSEVPVLTDDMIYIIKHVNSMLNLEKQSTSQVGQFSNQKQNESAVNPPSGICISNGGIGNS